jgi:hypothetical protein
MLNESSPKSRARIAVCAVQRWLIGLPVAAACFLVGPVGASANSASPGNGSPAVAGLGRLSYRRTRRIGLTAAGASRQARFNCGRPDSTTNEARVTRGAPGLVTKGTVR